MALTEDRRQNQKIAQRLRKAKTSLMPEAARVSFCFRTDFLGLPAILFRVALRKPAVEGRDPDEVVRTVAAAILAAVGDEIGDRVPYFRFGYA